MKKVIDEKKKILTISTSGLGQKDGIVTILLDYYKYVDKTKADLDIVSFGKSDENVLREFTAIDVKVIELPLRQKNLYSYIKALFKLFRHRKYDVLYIHGSSAIMAIELMVAFICGCKTRIVHSHNTTCKHRKADKILRPIFYCLYTRALACGKDAGEWLFGKRKFEIIKNGREIELYKFNPQIRLEMREVLKLNENTLAIGHVGNFNKQKNQEYLIRVFKELKYKNINAKLFLIGKGSDLENIQKLAEELALLDSIVFMGSINNVHEILQAMDIMVLPSLYEGLPLVVIEWQMALLPCLVSDIVTRECAFTDLVRFKSLQDGTDAWAEEIIQLTSLERNEKTGEIEELADKAGYNIRKNVSCLQKNLGI